MISEVSTIVSNIRRNVAKKKWGSFTLRLFMTLLLLVFLLRSLTWATLFAAIKQTTYVFLLLGVLIGVVASIISAYQWQILLRAEQIRVGLARLFKLYLIGIGFSHFLPTGMGGDVVKAWYVGRASGNYAGSASAVVITRLAGYFGMQLVAFSALLLFHRSIARSLVLWAILLSLLVGSMIGGVLLLTTLLPTVLKRTRVKSRVLASVLPVGEALIATIQRPRLLCSVTGVGAVFWVLSVLDYYTYAYALHLSVPLYFYFIAIPIVSLVAFLPITINGFGLRESAFVYVFSTAHVSTATALLLALLMDMQVLFFGIIGGCLYLTMNREDRIIKKQRETDNHDSRLSIAESTASVVWFTIAEKKATITWFTEEDQDVFDEEIREFDDRTPTLPMMLLSSRPRSSQGLRTGLSSQDATHWEGQQRFAASPTPVLQESRPKAIFGKNRRVILIKDEDKHEQKMKAPAIMAAGPFEADRSKVRGL